MTGTAALSQLAVEVAQEAGQLLAGYAQRHWVGAGQAGDAMAVQAKTSLTDPVSEADHAAERLIADRLLGARPDDGMLGEEDAANRSGTSGLRWVVDPLDGTVNFLYRIPQWCVSIACEDDHGSVVGVIHDPSRGETFVAVRDQGATLDGHALAVTDATDLSHTLVATGFGYDPAVRADQGRLVATMLPVVRDVRRGGSAALDLAWTAAGRFDAYLELGLAPWDWAAGRLLVAEAGGRVSRIGARIAGREMTGVLAGGDDAHDALATWWGEQAGVVHA